MSATVPETASHKDATEKKKCFGCGVEILRDAETCTVCLSVQAPNFCVECRNRIPAKANLCTICKSFQPWWRIFPKVTAALPVAAFLAMLSGIYSVATYLSDRNSDTRFMVASADANLLHLKVWNSGKKPSRLIRYRLKFSGNRMIEDAILDQAEGDAVIPFGVPVNVGLSVKELARSVKPGSNERYTKDEIASSLSDDKSLAVTVEVEVDVEESGHLWQLISRPFVVPRSDPLQARSIKEFILGRIPDVD